MLFRVNVKVHPDTCGCGPWTLPAETELAVHAANARSRESSWDRGIDLAYLGLVGTMLGNKYSSVGSALTAMSVSPREIERSQQPPWVLMIGAPLLLASLVKGGPWASS